MKHIVLILALVAGCAFAKDPYKIIVPYAPGGGTDIAARKLAEHLSKSLDSSILVSNVTGGNTSIGPSMAIRAKPDGSTMLISSVGALDGSVSQMSTMPYDWQRELRPVSIIVALTPWVLLVNNKYKSLDEFVHALKTRPVNFGSLTVAGNHAILVKMLLKELQIKNSDVEIVVYNSAQGVVSDVMTGQLDATFVTAYAGNNFINSGKVMALGVVGDTRSTTLPEVLTFSEQGIKNIDVGHDYYGLWVPEKTPDSIVDELRKTIYQYVKNDGQLHREFTDMNFNDSKFQIPFDPLKEQNKAVKITRNLHKTFIKN